MSSGFLVSDGGGWQSVGFIGEDDITLSTDNAGWVEHDLSLLRESFSGSITCDIVYIDRIAMRDFFDVPEIVDYPRGAVALEFSRKRRKEVLRERAEAVGGKFLRNYLRSQRISRHNSGSCHYATGGIMTKRLVFACASVDPSPDGMVVTAHAG